VFRQSVTSAVNPSSAVDGLQTIHELTLDSLTFLRRKDVSKLRVLAIAFVLLIPAALFADQIVLKNVYRLTGTIETSDDKALIIKTEFAGEVTVQWDAVREINSSQKLHVSLNNG